MNERIKEMSKQAHLVADATYAEGPDSVWLKEYNKKFAELIVRECGEVAYKAYWNNPETVRGIHIKEKIKKHFGVEE